MPITVTFTTHGRDGFDALAETVRAVKGGDPLTPVTVVVPTNTSGVMARRALGRRGGAAAIDVLTLYRVAELLGSPSLVAAGRKPVSTPIVDVAVKNVLASTPGLYHEVADHPSTVVALRNLYREVRAAGRGASTALGRTGRGSEPARVIAEVTRALARDWYDEGDLLERAAEVVVAQRCPARFRRVIVHGPERLRPLELTLLRSLGELGDVRLLVPRTGDDDADGPVLDLVAQLTGGQRPAPFPPVTTGDVTVVSTTDADDEARVAVRTLLDAARSGTRFDRMAVLWPSDRPYARLVEHHIDAAGLPWNGRPGTTVVERMVPRVLAELLELDRRGLRRVPLMRLLGDVPARDPGGRPVPTARWERIARDAGVVREEDWDRHLVRWVESTRAAALDDERSSLLARADDGAALGEFVAELRRRLGHRDARRPWRAWVAWAKAMRSWWFGPVLDRLTDAERVAAEQTDRVLDRLEHLDDIGPPVTRTEFRATLLAELEAVPARRGTLGDGVHLGSLSGARGLDLDLVVVVGAAEGLLPPPPVVDPLLSDDDRRRAGLVTSDERARNAHRQFLAVTTTTPRVQVVVPRGDLRATTVRHPSRWLGDLSVATERVVDSVAHGLASSTFPVSSDEHRRRELWVHARAGGDVRTHPRVRADPVAVRALALYDARASDRFTEYDGDLSSRGTTAFDRPISPTRIEAWVRCPHAYFVRYVLGVRPVEEPSELLTIDARERGSTIHAALHKLHSAVLAGALPVPGPAGWDEVHLGALRRTIDALADDLERRGRAGRAAYWVSARRGLTHEIDGWVAAERSNWGDRTLRLSESGFGDGGDVVVALPDGRGIAFVGSIDRVDELADGSLLVTDHKTGSAADYTTFAADPTLKGTHFQLPVYAAAARVLLGRPDAVVRAEYSFFSKGRFARYRATLDEPTAARSAARLADVVAGIEAGVFFARPDEPKWQLYVTCPYCDPDGLGTTERWPELERKRHDPRLARWLTADDTEAAG